jgi:hypothetical protein
VGCIKHKMFKYRDTRKGISNKIREYVGKGAQII